MTLDEYIALLEQERNQHGGSLPVYGPDPFTGTGLREVKHSDIEVRMEDGQKIIIVA